MRYPLLLYSNYFAKCFFREIMPYDKSTKPQYVQDNLLHKISNSFLYFLGILLTATV